LAACSSSPTTFKKTKEYFSQKTYGKASPRMVAAGKAVPKGGGRYHVGKPYRVAGRTYVPRDNPGYSATGLASWYGSAFHGRKTANGEVYDMNALSAAHPTLPLPSYVRVTNLENNRTVIVRVNDRGPFAHNRIIDLSKAAAELLGFQHKGTARVKVDFVQRAGLDGRDRNMLLATYTERGKTPAGGVAAGNRVVRLAAAPAPRIKTGYTADATLRPLQAYGAPLSLLPAYAAQDGELDLLAPLILNAGYVNSFAPSQPVTPAHVAARALAGKTDDIDMVRRIVQVGTFANPANADRAGRALTAFGRIEMLQRDRGKGVAVRVVRVVARLDVDTRAIIDAAASLGLAGAFVVTR
ncbi:MAG: septal ring lytic transglycosylase RlpA family protein, partial [Alphaproteobacteria bacterium]